MKRRIVLLPVLVLVLTIALLAASAASIAGTNANKSGGKRSTWQWTFNPTTMETVQGKVTGISLRKARKPKPSTEWLSLETDSGTVSVLPGPSSYLARERVRIHKGDSVSVTGSVVTRNKRTVLVATEIEVGDETRDLFTPDGRPLWSANAMQGK